MLVSTSRAGTLSLATPSPSCLLSSVPQTWSKVSQVLWGNSGRRGKKRESWAQRVKDYLAPTTRLPDTDIWKNKADKKDIEHACHILPLSMERSLKRKKLEGPFSSSPKEVAHQAKRLIAPIQHQKIKGAYLRSWSYGHLLSSEELLK